jgi:hypothetical protein
MLLDYERDVQTENTIMMSAMYGLALLFQCLEMGCYIIFYRHLYRHDTSMFKNSIITKDAYKNRQRRTIFSIGGQLCCYIAELAFVGNMVVWINVLEDSYVTSMKEVYFVFKICEFGAISTIQVLTSGDLRNILLDLVTFRYL